MTEIRISTFIESSIEIVFDLSRSIDLHKISTAHTNEEAIAGVTSGLISLNESVTWKAKHFFIYQKLTTKITTFNPPVSFTDEMTKGIFKIFKHRHLYNYNKEGVEMIDILEFAAPLGIIGRVFERVFLKNYLKRLLIKRNKIIKEFAESEKWKQILPESSSYI